MNNLAFNSYKKLVCLLVILPLYLLTLHAQPKNNNDMNCTLQTIHSRKSVRKFTNQAVPKETLEMLARAAMAAPSSKNIQPWSFYIITNRDKLNSLAELLPFAKMLTNAPSAIIVCGDNVKGVVNPNQSLNWALDCSAASQNLLLAAEAEGLGAVWTGVFPYADRVKVVKDFLQLPENIIPLNVIPVGYPDGEHKAKDKYNAAVINWIE